MPPPLYRPFPSAFSISLPTVSSSSLAYVLLVMRVEECPNIFATVSMSTPALSSIVAPVCRAQCVVIGLSTPAI